MKKTIIYLVTLSMLLLCACSPSKKEDLENTISEDDYSTISEIISDIEESVEVLEEAVDVEPIIKSSPNENIDLNSFKCSDEVKNASWQEGKYQYFDLVLPVGITFADLKALVKTSVIEFDNYNPTPMQNDYSQTHVSFPFTQHEETYQFSALICPPDLDLNTTIPYDEWIVVNYSISRHYDFGGNDYAWFPTGISINNQDWMPEDSKTFFALLDSWNLSDKGGPNGYFGSYANTHILFTFDNTKIKDYYFGVHIESSYQGNGAKRQFSSISTYATVTPQGDHSHPLDEVFDGTADRCCLSMNVAEANESPEIAATVTDTFTFKSNCTYEGYIENISLNEDGDYNITWAELYEYSPYYLPASDIANLSQGMIYEIHGEPYKCISGNNPDYWYFTYPDSEYDNYEDASKEGGDFYRIAKTSTGEQIRLEYIFLEATDTFSPSTTMEEHYHVNTIMDGNAKITYLTAYDHFKTIPFAEIYNSDYTSIYAGGWDTENTWRGFACISINSITNNKIHDISEQMVFG